MCLFLILKLHGYLGILQEKEYFVEMSGWFFPLWLHQYNPINFNAVLLVCDSAGFVLLSAIFSCLFFLAHILQIVKVLCLMVSPMRDQE